MASFTTDAYAKEMKLEVHDVDIKAAISQHDSDIKSDITQHDTDVKGILNNTINPNILDHDADIKAAISQHDSDIKSDITQHDTDVKGILNNTINPNILDHDGNMTMEHSDLDTKLDEILAAVQKVTTVGVPKTGQTTFFETGDDGDLQSGVEWPNPRFTDSGFETVTDNLTRLIWTKDANLFGMQIWSNALTSCNNLVGDGSILGGPTDGSVAGDWHLADLFELETLRHLGAVNPCVPDKLGTGHWSEGDPFSDVQWTSYWSSTTNVFDAGSAWFVHFGTGYEDGSGKGNGSLVWCVRGGQ